MLFLSSYYLFSRSGAIPPMPAFRVACALEIFHAFALVHDDIIDRSSSRRGLPSLHVRFKNTGAREDNAINLALVVGDILFGYAMECFFEPGLDPLRSQQAARYFLRIAQDTGYGQAVEIAHLEKSLEAVDEAEILHTYYLKTTRYTIECPLVLGALLTGASEDVRKTLCDFAQPLGLAFQIENDLHEIALLPSENSELAYDWQQGVKTLFLKQFHDELDADGRMVLDALLEGTMDQPQRKALRNLLEQTDVTRKLRSKIASSFREAHQVLGLGRLEPRQRKGLALLMDFLGSNSHHSEAEAMTRQAAGDQ
ncbi:MAG: polyprenyl synthetase family protein, partial [Verrucomicrobiota bacterium]